MIKSVVERLLDEIYEMKLLYDNIILNVSVSRETPGRPGFPPYSAIAKIHPGEDVKGHGETPEKALEYLKSGLMTAYAPNHETRKDLLHLNMESLWHGTGEDIFDLGAIQVYVPDSVEKRAPCGCNIRVELSVRDSPGRPDIAVTPRYNWCVTHLQAYTMRRLLEDELNTGRSWLGTADIRGSDDLSSHTILSVGERLVEVKKALGGIVND